MATYFIKWLKDKLGDKFFPVTHINAVRNDDGESLDELLDAKADVADIPTKTSDLVNDSGFINTANNNLANYYLKTETYTKDEIDDLVESVSNFEYVYVTQLPEASSLTAGKFYLYNGHRYVTVGENTYSWVDLGSYDIDLTDYVTDIELDDALEYRPIHTKVTEIEMKNMLDNGTWEDGVLYYTVEDEEEEGE